MRWGLKKVKLLLDVRIEGIPPGKNRRTRYGKGIVYTNDDVRLWMETTALLCRAQRKGAWQAGMEVILDVRIEAHALHTFDLDGALPCLVDAVMMGLADGVNRPPDAWIVEITAGKVRCAQGRDGTRVKVWGLEKGEDNA
jgi:hypothetical protein